MAGLRGRPHKKQPFDDLADGILLPGKDKHAWSRLTGTQATSKIDGGLASAETPNYVDVEILIRQEADSHVRFEPVCCRAAISRAKSSGFDSLSGGTNRSNSRSTSADMVIDQRLVLQVVGDLFRRLALLKTDDNRVEGQTSAGNP